MSYVGGSLYLCEGKKIPVFEYLKRALNTAFIDEGMSNKNIYKIWMSVIAMAFSDLKTDEQMTELRERAAIYTDNKNNVKQMIKSAQRWRYPHKKLLTEHNTLTNKLFDLRYEMHNAETAETFIYYGELEALCESLGIEYWWLMKVVEGSGLFNTRKRVIRKWRPTKKILAHG